MQAEYDNTNRGLDADDLEQRNNLLSKYRYSIIVEGGHMEFESLNKWIKQNISENSIKDLYYGKTDYDFGFAEFFTAEKNDEEKLSLAVPNIYTIYPHSHPPGKICKSNGSTKDIEYDSSNKNSIVYPIDEKGNE